MAEKDLIKRLNKLCQLDIDAARTYEQAMEHIDHAEIRSRLGAFKADHDRHIVNLSDTVRALGGEPPERSPDLKGFFLEGFTAIRSVTGTEGALKAMRTNEKLTNKSYDEALAEQGMPADVLAMVERNREDERRHLSYIERALETRIWEQGARTA